MDDPVLFYLDENMDPAVARGLRRRGIDVVTAHEVGRCGYLDPEQLEYATHHGRVIVTFDADYLAIHSTGIQHAGIVWTPALKYSIGQLISNLELVHLAYKASDLIDKLEYL